MKSHAQKEHSKQNTGANRVNIVIVEGLIVWSAHLCFVMAVSKYSPMKEAIKLTNVSWEPSFDATSAKFPRIAWCCVSAERVAPPATPTIALIEVVAHRMNVACSWKRGKTNISVAIAMSFSISARIRHFFESISNWELSRIEFQQFNSLNLGLGRRSAAYPFHHANRILPKWPAPSLSTLNHTTSFLGMKKSLSKRSDCNSLTHVTVAERAFTASLPTPTPFRIACVDRVPVQR